MGRLMVDHSASSVTWVARIVGAREISWIDNLGDPPVSRRKEVILATVLELTKWPMVVEDRRREDE